MDTRVLALVLGQFAVIGVLGVMIYDERKIEVPPLGAEVPTGRERPRAGLPVRSPGNHRVEHASAPADEKVLPESLDPAQARKLLDRNQKETKNLSERAEKAHAIILQLCQDGHAGEAWELIDVQYGLVRFRELEAFFQEAKLPPGQALARMDGLDGADRGSALKGYFGSFTTEELAALDLGAFKLDNARERAALLGNFADRLRAASSDQNPADGQTAAVALLDTATRLTAENKLSLADLGSLLALDKSQDSFAHWASLSVLPESMRKADPHYNGVQSMLVREMAIEDPEQLMKMTMTEGASEARFMHIALEKWLDVDNASATQWYESHHGNFSAAQNDCAAAAFLRTSVRYGEYENGLKWYDSLTAPDWKSALSYEQRNALNGLKKNAAKPNSP